MSNVFEEMRANRANAAEIRRADRQAEREEARRDRRDEQERADQLRVQRRERWQARRKWVADHPVDCLMAVIIVVPALLAWSAMAAYGKQIYGPLGVLLPLFTEAAMWAFAGKLHYARKAGAPTGWLQVGTWAFTTVAAALNFIHGQSLAGWQVGVVMAVVSTGGVIAHQIITAAPMRSRRSRSERLAARTRRLADKRIARMERVAVRQAIGELASDGSVRLLHRSGVVTLRRGWTGRSRLDHTQIPGLGDDGPQVDTVADTLGTEIEEWLRETPLPDTLPVPRSESVDTSSEQRQERAGEPHPETPPATPIEPARRSMEQLRAELGEAVQEGRVDPTSAESIRKTLRVGRDRAKQLRDEWNDGTAGVPA